VQLRATLVAVCWIVWVTTWVAAAFIFRPDAGGSSRFRPRKPLRDLGFRLVFGVLILLAIRAFHLENTPFGDDIGWVGLVVCVTGLGLATCARVCLGRSWGMPMTIRAKPRLIRRGPYRFVRHPIYSGLLLALVGSALACGAVWFLVAIAGGAYFVMSLRVEEADMLARFRNEYTEYIRETTRLIPFVY
jgi:protein-S-isoprenylcysteine O-methyltransferase Ste14